MTSDELADAIVTHLNAIADPLIVFQAIKPETVGEAEKERSDYGVFVIPYSESETRINRGDTCDSRLIVSVVVNGPVKTVTRATALKLVDQLRRSLRLTKFDGYRWLSNETVTLFSLEAIKEKNQFVSIFRAEYMGLN